MFSASGLGLYRYYFLMLEGERNTQPGHLLVIALGLSLRASKGWGMGKGLGLRILGSFRLHVGSL